MASISLRVNSPNPENAQEAPWPISVSLTSSTINPPSLSLDASTSLLLNRHFLLERFALAIHSAEAAAVIHALPQTPTWFLRTPASSLCLNITISIKPTQTPSVNYKLSTHSLLPDIAHPATILR